MSVFVKSIVCEYFFVNNIKIIPASRHRPRKIGVMSTQIRRRTFLKGTAAFGIGPWMPALRSVAGPPCDLAQLSSADLEALASGLSLKKNLLLPPDEGV